MVTHTDHVGEGKGELIRFAASLIPNAGQPPEFSFTGELWITGGKRPTGISRGFIADDPTGLLPVVGPPHTHFDAVNLAASSFNF